MQHISETRLHAHSGLSVKVNISCTRMVDTTQQIANMIYRSNT